MAGPYQITCVTKSTPTYAGHRHIVGVGFSNGVKWTVAQVRGEISAGTRFYTSEAGFSAWVEPLDCCNLQTLRSARDATTANNLDNLKACV
jgi:hypothetical protein